jgi:hypothetical protein
MWDSPATVALVNKRTADIAPFQKALGYGSTTRSAGNARSPGGMLFFGQKKTRKY